jgi:hypothetical protein
MRPDRGIRSTAGGLALAVARHSFLSLLQGGNIGKQLVKVET